MRSWLKPRSIVAESWYPVAEGRWELVEDLSCCVQEDGILCSRCQVSLQQRADECEFATCDEKGAPARCGDRLVELQQAVLNENIAARDVHCTTALQRNVVDKNALEDSQLAGGAHGQGATCCRGAVLKVAALNQDNFRTGHGNLALQSQPKKRHRWGALEQTKERRSTVDGAEHGVTLAQDPQLTRARARIDGELGGAAIYVIGAVGQMDDGRETR